MYYYQNNNKNIRYLSKEDNKFAKNFTSGIECIFRTLKNKLQHKDSFYKDMKEAKTLDFKIGAMCRDLYTPLNMKYADLDKIADTVEGVYKGVDKHDYDIYKLLDTRMNVALDRRHHIHRKLKCWFGYDVMFEERNIIAIA